jgi:acetolactate synthase-1/2/3 large subunit
VAEIQGATQGLAPLVKKKFQVIRPSNYTVYKSDLLLAFGVRFDDRVTGKLEAFVSRAKIVHIDINSAEIGKNKQPHVSVCADVKLALEGMNRILEGNESKFKLDF